MWGRKTLFASWLIVCAAGCTLDFDHFTAADGGGTGGSGGTGGVGGSGGSGGTGGVGGSDEDAGELDASIDAGPITCADNPCAAPATCDDSSGTVVCSCPTGFDPSVDGFGCVDIDECVAGTLTCHFRADCINFDGGARCECMDGFNGNGTTSCEANVVCTGAGSNCDANATCIDIDGTSYCVCAEGYTGDGESCDDINECETDNGGCSTAPMVMCANTAGGRTCGACPTGYMGNGMTCTDINECSTGNGGCSTAPMVMCTNTAGGRTCGACPSGYTGNGMTCTDVNECMSNNGGCGAASAWTCTNIPGGRTCADIDECATNNGGCDTSPDACTNSMGSFACACPATFQGNGVGANGCYAVRQVTTGFNHTCARFADGSVKCWGENVSGQLGIGDTNDRGDGANEMGTSLPAVNLGSGRTAVDIAAGDNFTCALLDNGRIKCWGTGNALGQGGTANLGDGANEVRDMTAINMGTSSGSPLLATNIEAGTGYACAILANGSMKCWGGNSGGQLGIGAPDGDPNMSYVWGDAPNEMGDNLPAVTLPFGAIRGVSLGDVYTGPSATCAISQSFGLYCWGGNGIGQLGAGNSDFTDMPGNMVNVGTNRTVIGVSAGFGHTCAILDGNELKCWGSNDTGELGQGDTNTRGDDAGEMGNVLNVIPLSRPVVAVEAGFRATCALHDDATVRCWGNGGMIEFGGPPTGHLGRNSTSTIGDGAGEIAALTAINLGTSAQVTQLSAQYAHACVVFADGRVKCWGYNASGQLGLGDTNNRGDEANEVGASLPFVDLRP